MTERRNAYGKGISAFLVKWIYLPAFGREAGGDVDTPADKSNQSIPLRTFERTQMASSNFLAEHARSSHGVLHDLCSSALCICRVTAEALKQRFDASQSV